KSDLPRASKMDDRRFLRRVAEAEDAVQISNPHQLLYTPANAISFPRRHFDLNAKSVSAQVRLKGQSFFDVLIAFRHLINSGYKDVKGFVKQFSIRNVPEFELKYALARLGVLAFLGDDAFALFRQIAVAVAIDVELVAVLPQPHPRLGFGAEDEQAVFGFG